MICRKGVPNKRHGGFWIVQVDNHGEIQLLLENLERINETRVILQQHLWASLSQKIES
jgi:hypothetical protein